MKRLYSSELIKWKKQKDRKPILLQGVRQCGKTYLLKEFGAQTYTDTAYFNFEGNEPLQNCFARDLDTDRIITELGILRRRAIKPEETLIILDEIQFCNRALTALKYFYENAPQYHIVCAGSLLGVALSTPLSFPVGKTELHTLHPMSFYEFVLASGEEETLTFLAAQAPGRPVPESLTGRMTDLLKTYYVTGGMPEAVGKWLGTKDVSEVEKIQRGILDSYDLDFAKHAPTMDIPKLGLIWKSIPTQLARENSKFMFGHAKHGARAKDLEDALEWLLSAGLAHKVMRVENPALPLSAAADPAFFKLYAPDVGLLRVMAGLPAEAIFTGPETYREFRGAMAENFTLTELLNAGLERPYYWKSGNTAEVDFLAVSGIQIVPIEVKAGRNRARSLGEYRKKYSPQTAIIASMDNSRSNGVKYIPLYMLWRLKEYLSAV